MKPISRRRFLGTTSAGIAAAGTLSSKELRAIQTEGAAPPPSPTTSILLKVNGQERRVEVEDRWTLAEVFRDHLGLTGTKIGCDRSQCGACTVLLDGSPIYSCTYLAVWADGRELTTVEGLANGDQLDPLQQSFIDHDGPQCGFCTSGQLMSATALLANNPSPTRDEVRQGLAGNICRCSNYNRYVDSVSRKPLESEEESVAANPMSLVGAATPRLDAVYRVTGRADYTGDVNLPGMLYARVLRSPHPHARILRIDTSPARALPGVEAVLTHENCAIQWSSGDSRNERRLFNNPVKYYGDAVAAVAARDRHLAEEALEKIEVEYEPLDFVLDPERALENDAPVIQPGGNLSPRSDGTREPEIYERGDLEAGLAASDIVLEDTYVTKHINNAQMEPRVAIAEWQGGKLTVWTCTQGIANCRRDLARDMDLPQEDVRVICHYMGGGFGNKNQCQDSDLMAAALAKDTRRPVKLEFTRLEDFLCVHGRWPTRQHYRVGARQDGTLQAIELRGYSGMGPHRKSSGDIAGTELYTCPNLRKTIYPVYTNMSVSANFRAPAYPQGVFGMESIMDDLAHRLEMDPVAFRLKNATRMYHDETPFVSWAMPEVIRTGAERFQWSERWRRPGSDAGPMKRGVGMAMGAFAARVGRSNAVLRLDSSGRLFLHVGVTDIGTGAKTTMAMIAAEAMGFDLDRVEVVWGDTDRSPYSVGESGSRTTNYTGYAVVKAAENLKRQIDERGLPEGDEVLVAEAAPEPSLDGKARYASAAHFVEVEVDTELGGVRVLKYLAVHESGRIINPLTAVSQVKGGVTQGIGMALHEELLYDQNTGIPLNPGYYGARVMTHLDTPDIEVHFLDASDEYGPYGAKSVGESTIIPAVAAIGNAIFNATGVRFKELPMSRDRILEALS